MARVALGWRPVAFAMLRSAARLLDRGGRALHCIGVGLLDPPALRAEAERRWGGFFANELDAGSGLFDWERDFYARVLHPEDRILLVGAGTGRDLIALRELGHHVEGLELSPRATAFARAMLVRRGLAPAIRVGAVEEVDLGGPWDVVIFSWTSYGLIPGTAARVRVLRRTAATLGPDGRIILNVFTRGDAPQSVAWKIVAASAWLFRSGWRPEPGDQVADEPDGVHFEHRFAPSELAAEAAAAGLTVAHQTADGRCAVLVPARDLRER